MVTLAGSELNNLVDSPRSRLTEVQSDDANTDLIQEIEVPDNLHSNITVEGLKMQTSDQFDASPVPNSSRGASISTNSPANFSDDASAQSVSVSQTPEPQSASTRPSTSAREDTVSSVLNQPRPSSSRSSTPHEEGPLSQQQRRARQRNVIEGRSANRLSGFFNSLMSRRDTVLGNNNRGNIRDEPPPSASTPIPEAQSRPSSPPPTRPSTPPPSLAAPTLQELGLSFSVLTSDLSPSHFSTPPTSGAFMAPHYLLLCHAQGLDVLPLVSPPAPQPYALIRRVNFKSVVVMEHRGVLVAIAGRRYGVRVYALEEVKKMVEWRMDVEIKREQERSRRENVKKLSLASIESVDERRSNETRKTSLSTPPPGTSPRTAVLRKSSYTSSIPPLPISNPSSQPLVPRPPTYKPPRKQRITQSKSTGASPNPGELPPSYATATSAAGSAGPPSNTRHRSGSASGVLAAIPRSESPRTEYEDSDIKADWAGASDDEAIDIVAAGPSGSQALDERTSTQVQPSTPAPMQLTTATSPSPATHNRTGSMASRRNRPSNLDLSVPRSTATAPEPSPSPTLVTLRQALSASPVNQRSDTPQEPETPVNNAENVEEDDDEGGGGLSLAQILMESRLPDLPPLGTRQPQQPILLPSASVSTAPSSPRTSEGHETPRRPDTSQSSSRRRRRWSVLLGGGSPETSEPSRTATPVTPTTAPPSSMNPRSRFTRSQSFRSAHSYHSTVRPATAGDTPTSRSATHLPSSSGSTPTLDNVTPTQSSRTSRFFPRLLSNALQGRRSDERSPVRISHLSDTEATRRGSITPSTPHAPPPKLEYVKLPGTKGALMIKAVETQKKSFLAILCGENGEKVELFAGTYRTALGLSRTFILPDSPRSLELQLQGDDLVEVFLVFTQNVFGLEPATVRVREVRIGRAERRAARRRAREARAGEPNATDTENAPGEEDTNVSVSIGVSVPAITGSGENARPGSPTLVPAEHPDAHTDNQDTQNDNQTPVNEASSAAIAHADELVTLATANMGPYTTFQQLGFAPKFPLASIADDYIIPPTYASFLDYRAEYEPEGSNNVDLTRVQFTPPGLPVPVPTAPSKWYYRDPKGVVHGPWKSALMHAWYKDGMLPPDLPVRREEDENFMLLKDLRLQSVDPTSPFLPPPPPAAVEPDVPHIQETGKPLLKPISLLSQPKHFGPPALFFSSRGGHSTSIVDARGRSVIRGRFVWSSEESTDDTRALSSGRMGDVKRLEALDVQDRSILVAMRQGGLEAVDLSDALLNPADESRTAVPNFTAPPSSINRRTPYVWKIGTPVSTSATSSTVLSSKSKGSIMGRKSVSGPTKSPSNRTEFTVGDGELDSQEEMLFLGRDDDNIYFCERNSGTFRILRMCPSS